MAALSYGMATHCEPLEQLDATVAEFGETIAANNADSIATDKDLHRHQQDLGLTEGLRFEYDTHYSIAGASDRLKTFGER